MHTFFASPAIYLYIFGVVVVNILFSYVPMIQTSYGDFSPVAILVGFIFVIRDYAQRATGHWVLVAMAIACLASYLMADPFVALASVLAFASSEIFSIWLIDSRNAQMNRAPEPNEIQNIAQQISRRDLSLRRPSTYENSNQPRLLNGCDWFTS